MKLSRFTAQGAKRFVSFLEGTRTGAPCAVPEDMLSDPVYVERIRAIETPSGGFASKLAFAQAARAAFANAGIEELLRTDRLLWMWLTARYFEDLCMDAQGHPRRPLKDLHRYATTGLGREYTLDKNLLYFPWKMLLLHGESAHWMLEAPLGADTKVTRELANSYRKNVHTGFVDLARRLYFDGKRRTIRKGATNNKAAGNLRDLERTVSRLDMTYDVFGADAKQLMAMLPENRFRRWIKHAIVEGD
jgi:hypothetical protein